MVEFFATNLCLVLVAFSLDMLLGDRDFWWRHPVCYIGDLLNYLEKAGRSYGGSRLYFAGFICASIAVSIVGLCAYVLISIPLIGWIFSIYLAYAGLSTKSLLTFFHNVLRQVEHGSIEQAQKAVSQLVSRDTTVLNRQELRKTLGDTFSENYTDAVVAPLFWLCFGGPVGLWMYKTVSTMDSMWGYKTEAWEQMGFAAAKSDDILAYIPARLGVLFFFLAERYAKICKFTGGIWPGYKIIFMQAKFMPSPNSGLPMACAAWLMNARLGGPSVYFGSMVQKPWLGPDAASAKPWDKSKLEYLSQIMLFASYVAFFSFVFILSLCVGVAWVL